ncbi:phage tail protein [Pseudomonas xanthosomatis]|uniref:phage tail protein n=1 Tax=Pseudomonas xanthosomatis TaxID=2842356 RepID=UPI0035183825
MEPFVGEIRLFAFGRTPSGWLPCNGQLITINENQALFSLLGTTFGGNGSVNFGLPDLRGRVAISRNDVATPALGVHAVGSTGGQETVSMTTAQMPQHTHLVNASNLQTNQATPANGFFSTSTTLDYKGLSQPAYAVSGTQPVSLDPATVGNAGEGAPMNNMQPFLSMNYCIATVGYYPNRQ